MEKEGLKKFIEKIRTELDKRMLELPYQFNIIDEMRDKSKRVSENSHSKILARLLQYRNSKGDYCILNSLINIIINKENSKEWERIKFNNPKFILEGFCPSDKESNGRIDLLISDGNYAIIFENKANEPKDQNHQLGRYIKYITDSGIKQENLFVVYLPKEGNDGPSDDSWKYEEDNLKLNYKSEFTNRFSVISYKDKILAWIKEDVSTIVKDSLGDLLKDSLTLYINYLERWLEGNDIESQETTRILNAENNSNNTEYKTWLDSFIQFEDTIKEQRYKKYSDRQKLEESRTNIYNLMNGLYANSSLVHSVSGRVVHIGYKIRINERSYIVYIGENPSGLFCSLISKDKNKIDEKILSSIKELSYHDKDFIYIYDGYDYDYKILPKLELFFKVMDKCEELKKQEKKV